MTDDNDRDEDWEVLSQEDANGRSSSQNFHIGSRRLNLGISMTTTKVETFKETTSYAMQPQLADRPHHPQQQSPLFRLPLEIRAHIYQVLLSLPFDSHGTALLPSTHGNKVITILGTCRRALIEAETIFYAVNRFSVNAHALARVSKLGDARRNAISKLTIRCNSSDIPLQELSLLHLTPSLESLYFVRNTSIKYTNVAYWKMCAKQFEDGLRRQSSLREVKFFTPRPTNLSSADEERLAQMNEIDKRLAKAIPVTAGGASAVDIMAKDW